MRGLGLNRSLSGRAVLYTVGQLSINFLSVISAPIFVRLMTTAEYGMAAVYFTWVTILANIVALRADASIQNAWAEFGERRLPAYVSSVSFLAFCFFVLVFVVCLLAKDQLAGVMSMQPVIVLLCVVTSFFIACSNIRMCYLNVTKNATGNMLISLVLAVSQVVCSIVLLVSICDDGYVARIAGYSIPSIILGFCFLLFFWIKGKLFFNRDYWKFCLTLSLPLIFNGIAYMLINQCDRLMINSMIGPDAAGIYSFAHSCALPASVVCSAMNSAWTPEYFELMKTGDTVSLQSKAHRYMTNITLVTMAIMLVSPEILIVLGTESYYPGISMLPLVVMAYYFQYLYTWPVNCEFFYKKTKLMTAATLAATGANIALNLWMTPKWGIVGSAAASLMAFALLFVFHDMIARFKTPNYMFSWGWYLRGIVPVVIVLVVSYLLISMPVARWVIACVVCVFLVKRIVKNKSIF